MKFNERLRQIRKRSKITQKIIADHLGIALRTYQRYEEGTIEPPLSTAISIAAYFDVPMDCLIGNGFFSNWEEVLSVKKEILDVLYELYPSFSERHDLYHFSEGQLAHLLPALFSKVYLDDKGSIILEPFLPVEADFSPGADAEESQTDLPNRPNV